MLLRLLSGLVLSVALIGCGGEERGESEETASAPDPVVEEQPAEEEENMVPPPKDLGDGLRYETLALGEGTAAEKGDQLRLQMSLEAKDSGEQVWSGEYGFALGSGQAMEGLDRAVRGMKPGEKRLITIPARQTKLQSGRLMPGVPRGSAVMAEVELLSVEEDAIDSPQETNP